MTPLLSLFELFDQQTAARASTGIRKVDKSQSDAVFPRYSRMDEDPTWKGMLAFGNPEEMHALLFVSSPWSSV